MSKVEEMKIAIAPYTDTLEGMGWEIDIKDETLGLYRYFKNGKRRKTPDVYMLYNEPWEDEELGIYAEGPIERHWYVKTLVEDRVASSYKHLEKAVERFMEYASWSAEMLELKP